MDGVAQVLSCLKSFLPDDAHHQKKIYQHMDRADRLRVRGERTVSDDLSPRACEVGSQMEAAVGRGGRQSVGIGAEEGEVMDGGGVTEAGSLGFSKQPMDHMGTERPLMCYMGTGCSS